MNIYCAFMMTTENSPCGEFANWTVNGEPFALPILHIKAADKPSAKEELDKLVDNFLEVMN